VSGSVGVLRVNEEQISMSKTITIDDIAREAGVSPSTVSRVINGSKRVASDKQARVLAVIEQHNYAPNAVARGLVRGRSMTIGVLMQDISSPFFAQIIAGIERGLERAAYWPIFASTHWRADHQEHEIRSLKLLMERQVDGLIVLASSIPDDELRAVAQQIPLIVVARRIAGIEDQCLYIDNEGAGQRATRYLIGLGHTSIAHITGALGHPDAADRLAGYQRALIEAGLGVTESLIVQGQLTEDSGVRAIETLLGRGDRFTAVFAGNDQMAYGAMLGLYNHGYRIPEDVSLVGFDDQLLSAYTLPPLTTVRQPSVAMGEAAALGLLRLLQDQAPQLPSFPAELIIRTSAMRLR
jgi:LacI family transcriptional regulator